MEAGSLKNLDNITSFQQLLGWDLDCSSSIFSATTVLHHHCGKWEGDGWTIGGAKSDITDSDVMNCFCLGYIT